MAEPTGREIIERFARALEAKDFDTQEALLADDTIADLPQSGERIHGKANWMAIARNYPGGVGTIQPASSRLVGSDDQWVSRAESGETSSVSRAPPARVTSCWTLSSASASSFAQRSWRATPRS